MGKTLGVAALAVAAAIKATGAHRYRYRTPQFDKHVIEVYRSDEHAFFYKGNEEGWVKLRPGVPVSLPGKFEVRVVPSK